MRRSLEELQTLVPARSENGRADLHPSARKNGKRPQGAWPRGTRRLRAIAERGPVLVRIMRTETHCRWANRAWLEFAGRSLEQLLERGWLEDVHPEDRGHCERNSHDGFRAGRLYRVEYRLRRKGGDYGWVLEVGTPRVTARGLVNGYLVTAIEITEHKQAETHLALQYAIGRILAEATTLEEAAVRLLKILCESLGWDLGELWLVDPREGVPRCAQIWASPSIDTSCLQAVSNTRVFPPGVGVPWQDGRPLWIVDIAADAHLAHEPEAEQLDLRTMFRLPVRVQGEVCALVRVFGCAVRQPDPAVTEFMTAIGVQVGQFLERQRVEARIRESEARKAAILEASLDAVITIDHEGLVVEFNSAAETLFGYRRAQTLGHTLMELIVPPRLRAQVLDAVAHFQATGDSGVFGKRFDAEAMKADGAEFPVEIAMTRIPIGNPPLLTIFVCDATQRKDSEREVRAYQERLRALMADLLLAEEHERRRLASDLHDGLSQTIALMRIKLSSLRLATGATMASPLDELDELVQQANSAARSIGFELSPPVLHDLGLEPALHWLVENIRARYGIEIELDDDGQPKPADETTRVILYRSIRELLINAAKHAGARRVLLRLRREQDRLDASVEDDGIGMETDLSDVKGTGLFSIHERLSHVGGSMHIESAPGRGTKIRLCAPLTNGRSKKEKERVEA